MIKVIIYHSWLWCIIIYFKPRLIKYKHKKEKNYKRITYQHLGGDLVLELYNDYKILRILLFFYFYRRFCGLIGEKKSTCDEIVAATCAHAQVLSSTLTVKTADGCARRDYHWKNDEEDDDDSSLVASFAGAVFCERRGVTVYGRTPKTPQTTLTARGRVRVCRAGGLCK